MSRTSSANWAAWLVATLVLSTLVHIAAVRMIPSFITFSTLWGLYQDEFQDNRLYFGGVKNAPNDIVPLDNPDNMSSFAIYDVTDAPVRIKAAVPRGVPYWSLAFTAYNTDAIDAINDLQIEGDDIVVVVKREGAPYTPRPGERVIESPTDKGIFLVRMILPRRDDQDAVDRLADIQRSATLQVVDVEQTGQRRADEF